MLPHDAQTAPVGRFTTWRVILLTSGPVARRYVGRNVECFVMCFSNPEMEDVEMAKTVTITNVNGKPVATPKQVTLSISAGDTVGFTSVGLDYWLVFPSSVPIGGAPLHVPKDQTRGYFNIPPGTTPGSYEYCIHNGSGCVQAHPTIIINP